MKPKKPRAYLQVIVGSFLGLMLGFGVHQFFIMRSSEPGNTVSASLFTENQCRACREFTGCANCDRDQAYCAALAYQELTQALQDAAILACADAFAACRTANQCEAICGFFCNGQACSGAGGYCTSDSLCCAGQGLTCNTTTNRCEGDPCQPYKGTMSECDYPVGGPVAPPAPAPSPVGGSCGVAKNSCYAYVSNGTACQVLDSALQECEPDLTCENNVCVDPCAAQIAQPMPECDTDDQGNGIPPYFPPSGPGEVCDTVRKCYVRSGTTCTELSATSFCEDTQCDTNNLCTFASSSSSSSSSQPMCCNLLTQQCERF